MKQERVLRVVIIAVLLLTLCFNVSAQSYVSFNDNFDGNALDLSKWIVFGGNPVVNGGWLALSEANVQSKPVFSGGILQGVIRSSDWKPQRGQFTDSSFGLEMWNAECHYGILFKPSGHLAVLSPQPDADGNCSGDPSYQAYPPIPDWETIRAGETVSFTISWRPGSVTLKVNGNGREGEASYSGSAVPNVPLKVRLYAQTGETFGIDYLRLSALNAVFLPNIRLLSNN